MTMPDTNTDGWGRDPSDPDYAGDFADLKVELGRKVDQNMRRAAELAERHGVGLDTASYNTKKLDFLISVLLPPDTQERFNFEIAWQDKIAASLEEAFRIAVQAKRDAKEEVSPLDRLTLPPNIRRDNGTAE
jgi:hypothetical protein